MGQNYRCSDKRNCGRRRSLKHDISWYLYRPKCPGCGKDRLLPDPSVYRQTVKRGCFCQGPAWPHNKGRFEDENHVCVHAEIADLGELGVFKVFSMDPAEDPPF